MNNNNGKSKDTSLGNEAVGTFRKAVGWMKKNKETATLLVTIIGVLGAWVGLIFLIIQTNSLQQQTHTLQSDYEARTRPYLSVGNITVEQYGNTSFVDIMIDIFNRGQLPATKVDLPKIVLGPLLNFNEKTNTISIIGTEECPEPMVTVVEGTPTISVCPTYLTSISQEGFPSDYIFFPEMHHTITVRTDKSQYDAAITKWGAMSIAIPYRFSDKVYYYIAEAEMQGGEWTVKFHRGN